MQTKRLILRRWNESDAGDLYKYAMLLRIVVCKKFGLGIMKAIPSPSAYRKNADSSISGDQKMWMCR